MVGWPAGRLLCITITGGGRPGGHTRKETMKLLSGGVIRWKN